MSNDMKYEDLTVTKTLFLGKGTQVKKSDRRGDPILANRGGAEILSAARTLDEDDYGKTFFLALAGGFTVTLPEPKLGAYLKFIISVSPTTAYVITTKGGSDIMIGGINENEVDTGDDGPYDANADTLNFVANTAVVGDYVEMESDGTSWFYTGQTNADGGVTTSTT